MKVSGNLKNKTSEKEAVKPKETRADLEEDSGGKG